MENINLNSIVFNELVTKEDILKCVNQEEIYSYYLGEDVSKLGLYNSPLREDSIPSFALYFHKTDRNTIMFYDFATKDCGDFIILVSKMFGLNYHDALLKIAFDLGLSKFSVDVTQQIAKYTKIKAKESIQLGIKLNPWKVKDKAFWQQFGISKQTLEKFNVHPISHIFYNDVAVKAADLAYVYVEQKDDKVSYKIYQPLETKVKKWINNADYSVHQGYTNLPTNGDLLIITKSLKDVMSIHDNLNIPAVGLQSESVTIKDSVMDEYKRRFKKIICLFDNDAAGQKLTQLFVEKYQLPYIFMPTKPGVTDFSDLVKIVGKQEAVTITKKLLKNEIRD